MQLLRPVVHNISTMKLIFSLREKQSSAIDLSYRVAGFDLVETDPPPIIILHGLLGSKRNWKNLTKVLVKVTKRSVIPVDLRNHGLSPHASPHNYEVLAADIARLYRKLSIQKACMIGHSMGGRTAMVMALTEPSKVENLVVIDISPTSTAVQLKEFFPKMLAEMKKIDFKGLDTVPKARAAVKKHLLPIVTDDITLGAILLNISKNRKDKIGWLCNLDVLIRDFQYITEFPKSMKGKVYPGPTLFIGGQLSEFIPADDLPSIRELFPQAVVKYIPKAGHYVHVDNTSGFLQLVISFLRINE